MVEFETFMFGLMIISTFTALATEAVKKGMPGLDAKLGSSAVAGIASVILSVGVSAAYMILANIDVSLATIVYVVGMTFLSWLCSMLGYDKVVKVISQLRK